MSPLVWAYIGDSVYELYIRMHLVNNSKAKPHKLHIESIKYVKAKAQAHILKMIENNLTEKEMEIIKEEEMQKTTIFLKMLQYKIICIQQDLKHL